MGCTMTYKIREHPLLPKPWEVEVTQENGKLFIVLFGGWGAQGRALQYMHLMQRAEKELRHE